MSRSLLRVLPERTAPDSALPVSRTQRGLHRARTVAANLISNGVEFHVEPLPDNAWEFTVKREALPVLIELVDVEP